MDIVHTLKNILEDVDSDSSINITIDNHIENHIENNNINNTSIEEETNESDFKDIFNKSLPYIKIVIIMIVNTVISFIINKTNKQLN